MWWSCQQARLNMYGRDVESVHLCVCLIQDMFIRMVFTHLNSDNCSIASGGGTSSCHPSFLSLGWKWSGQVSRCQLVRLKVMGIRSVQGISCSWHRNWGSVSALLFLLPRLGSVFLQGSHSRKGKSVFFKVALWTLSRSKYRCTVSTRNENHRS